MKQILFFILFALCSTPLFSQNKVYHYEYDDSGNRITRYLEIIPPPPQQRIANFAQVDSVQTTDSTEVGDLQEGKIDLTNEVLVYPNPTFGIVNVDVKNGNTYDYSLANSAGQIVQQGLFSATSTFDMSRMERGNYFLILNTDTGERFTWKIVKQ